MAEHVRVGRPRAVTREMLAEAACDLFLEQGYEATSVSDITQRAGVSRATFFNYIPTKSDLLWASIDDELALLGRWLDGRPRLDADGAAQEPVVQCETALLQIGARLQPGPAVLAFANAEQMEVCEELAESTGRRQNRIGRIVATHLGARGVDELRAEVVGSGQAGAFLAALRAWSRGTPGRTPFAEVLSKALGVLTYR